MAQEAQAAPLSTTCSGSGCSRLQRPALGCSFNIAREQLDCKMQAAPLQNAPSSVAAPPLSPAGGPPPSAPHAVQQCFNRCIWRGSSRGLHFSSRLPEALQGAKPLLKLHRWVSCGAAMAWSVARLARPLSPALPSPPLRVPKHILTSVLSFSSLTTECGSSQPSAQTFFRPPRPLTPARLGA